MSKSKSERKISIRNSNVVVEIETVIVIVTEIILVGAIRGVCLENPVGT